jgi:hypothetical protein
MRRLVESLERRDHARTRRELPCQLLVNGLRHRGIVRDFSAQGLFVETPGELYPGACAVVSFRTPEGRRFVLEATVPHQRPVSHSLTFHTSNGFGLCIQDPPGTYLRWVETENVDG